VQLCVPLLLPTQYTSAAEIWQDLGVHSIKLLTNVQQKVECLQAARIHISGTHSMATDLGANERLRRQYEEKIQEGHRIR
jgi:GTP cyclohydrolase II